jgi:hypothetical protein
MGGAGHASFAHAAGFAHDGGGGARFAHADGAGFARGDGFGHGEGFGNRNGFAQARAHEHGEGMHGEGMHGEGRHEHHVISVSENQPVIYGIGPYDTFDYSPFAYCPQIGPDDIGNNFDCFAPRKAKVQR